MTAVFCRISHNLHNPIRSRNPKYPVFIEQRFVTNLLHMPPYNSPRSLGGHGRTRSEPWRFGSVIIGLRSEYGGSRARHLRLRNLYLYVYRQQILVLNRRTNNSRTGSSRFAKKNNNWTTRRTRPIYGHSICAIKLLLRWEWQRFNLFYYRCALSIWDCIKGYRPDLEIGSSRQCHQSFRSVTIRAIFFSKLVINRRHNHFVWGYGK